MVGGVVSGKSTVKKGKWRVGCRIFPLSTFNFQQPIDFGSQIFTIFVLLSDIGCHNN